MSDMHRTCRLVRAALFASLAAVMSACATTGGTSTAPTAAPAASGTSSTFTTGRLVVYVTDQNGRNLDRAVVDVTGEGGYRASSVTDRNGSVTFNGVPQVVSVSVIHQGGSYSQNFIVSPTGTSEMRMIVQIMEFEDPQAEDPAGGAGGAGGFGF